MRQILINGLILITILIVLLTVRCKLINYRIKKSYYGNNEYEAREIISQVLKNKFK